MYLSQLDQALYLCLNLSSAGGLSKQALLYYAHLSLTVQRCAETGIEQQQPAQWQLSIGYSFLT